MGTNDLQKNKRLVKPSLRQDINNNFAVLPSVEFSKSVLHNSGHRASEFEVKAVGSNIREAYQFAVQIGFDLGVLQLKSKGGE